MSVNQIRFPQAHSTGIQQRVTAGNKFDGTLPPGDTTDAGDPDANGLCKYDPAGAGGLFVWNCNEPIIVTQLHCDLGGSADATVSIVNLDDTGTPITGEEIIIYMGTSIRYLALDETHFRAVLLKNQALKLTTSSPGQFAQIAQALACLERTFVR